MGKIARARAAWIFRILRERGMDSDVHFRRKARQLLVEGIMAADAIGASPGQTVDDAAANFAAPL